MTAAGLDLPPAPAPRARKLSDHHALPLFRIPGVATDAAPLAIIAGGLILDLGEAERTFIYRCQDRFLAYTSLFDLRSIFFVAGDAHLAIYRAHIAAQRARFELIRRRTGLFQTAELSEPLYVGCDIDRMRVFACSGFADQWKNVDLGGGIALNQISPTYAALLAELAGLLRDHGRAPAWALDDGARLGNLAARCADKADYLGLVAGGHDLPSHVPTILVTANELCALPDFAAAVALYQTRSGSKASEPPRLFVKSTRNSSGNLAALVEPANFSTELERLRRALALEAATAGAGLDRQTAELRGEVDAAPCLRPLRLPDERLRAYKREQASYRQRVDFLVQAEVRRADGDSGFAGIGLSYLLSPDGAIAPLGATAQIYRDPDHKHFQGAYLCDAVAQGISPALHDRMLAMCWPYVGRGYHGPINFDARRDCRGKYQLIYDCNPRLTGIFPSLAVREGLYRSGIDARSVLSFGYRGEFVLSDLDAALTHLEEADLLCTRARTRGVVLLPNLCRDNGFDVHLVNMGPDEANRLLGGALGNLSSSALPRLYC